MSETHYPTCSVLELVGSFVHSPLLWLPTESIQARRSRSRFLSLNTDDRTKPTRHHGSEFAKVTWSFSPVTPDKITIVGMILGLGLCVNLTYFIAASSAVPIFLALLSTAGAEM